MYQYIYNSRCYQRCISIFIIVGATRDVCITVGATKDVSVYL